MAKRMTINDLKDDQKEVLLNVKKYQDVLKSRGYPKVNSPFQYRKAEIVKYRQRGISPRQYQGEYAKNSVGGPRDKSERYRHMAIFKELENDGLVTITREESPRMGGGYWEQYGLTKAGRKLVKQIEEQGSSNGGQSLTTRVSKISSFIFILASLFFMLYQDKTTPTGNAIGGLTSSSGMSFFLSFILLIIGGVLFYNAFKKE